MTRLEQSGRRMRLLLGGDVSTSGIASTTESSGAPRPLGATDVELLAKRITLESGADPVVASSLAQQLVDSARSALVRLNENPTGASLSDSDAWALESVIHVRGRPALRVYADRLESLDRYAGSEFWQELVSDHETRIVSAAAATAAVVVSAPVTGFPPWIQGSAWLVAPNRVVTNRHVVAPPPTQGESLVEPAGGGAVRVRSGYSLAVEFFGDDRKPAAKQARRVTEILYVAPPQDSIDIAILAIEPMQAATPLKLQKSSSAATKNLVVVGHPAPLEGAADEVKAVFGNPDGRKRVSFGKRMETARVGEMAHDASTIGGYSGGPVVAASDGSVIALHYYGDPKDGNLAVTADAIRNHASFSFMQAPTP